MHVGALRAASREAASEAAMLGRLSTAVHKRRKLVGRVTEVSSQGKYPSSSRAMGTCVVSPCFCFSFDILVIIAAH